MLKHAVGEHSYTQCHVFAGGIVTHKPAPDIYLKVLEDLGLDASECVVIEDSGIGVEAAVAAGLTVLVTVSTYTAEDDFSHAAVVLPSLGDPGRPFAGGALCAEAADVRPAGLRLPCPDIAQLIHH